VSDNIIGAGGIPEVSDILDDAADLFATGVDSVSGQVASAGNMDTLDPGTPTIIVFPETMHNDPQYGHVVHFDIYNKKPIKTLSGSSNVNPTGETNTVQDQIQNLGGANSQSQMLGSIDQEVAFASENRRSDPVLEADRLGMQTEKSADKITLYMPKGLRNTDNINYSDVDFGLIKGILEGRISSLIPGIAQKAAGFVDGLAEITSTELNSQQAMSSVTGAVRNPRKEQLFEGVGLRNFEFTFNLFPKSEKESHDVMNIIKLFRFHAYPEIVPNMAFYRIPSEFQITYIDLKYPTNNPLQQLFGGGNGDIVAKENKWLNKIARCALTNVATEYFPMDSMSTFNDGAPTIVNLSLTFTEMEAMSRNHIRAGY